MQMLDYDCTKTQKPVLNAQTKPTETTGQLTAPTAAEAQATRPKVSDPQGDGEGQSSMCVGTLGEGERTEEALLTILPVWVVRKSSSISLVSEPRPNCIIFLPE